MITTAIDHGKKIVSNAKNVKTVINPTEVTKNKSINISVNKNLKDDDVKIEDPNDRREENSIYTFNNFCVDYSKRGTAKCKICKKHILKDELRMGSYTSFKGISMIYYSHVPCFFKRMKRARVESNVISNVFTQVKSWAYVLPQYVFLEEEQNLSNKAGEEHSYNNGDICCQESDHESGSADPIQILKDIKHKNIHRLTIASLNINGISKKFDNLVEIVKGYIDILVIVECKLDASYTTQQFNIEGFATPF